MNPHKYSCTDINPVTKNMAIDIWNFDKIKIQCAIDHNYTVLVIWESDIVNNKDKILEKCKNFLK